MSKNVSGLRNASAHGERVTMSATKSGVSQICELLAAFHLDTERATSVQKLLEALPDDQDNKPYLCCLDIEDCCPDDFAKFGNSKRIFRPQNQYFVGRKHEVATIASALTCKGAGECGASVKSNVLVFGPPGIGKSHLAAEVAHCLQLGDTYKVQTWLSCAAPCHLEQDLSIAAPVNPNTPCDRTVTGGAPSSSLVVFDDVHISTVSCVHQLIKNSCCSAIITTKSPTVKLILQIWIPSLHLVNLKPFSLEESQELVCRKVKMSGIDVLKNMASIDIMLRGALGSLPLSVSVYSSLLAVSLKKPDRTTFDIFDEQAVIENWENIEERFGDRFHVRGFTGVVQSAKSYLRKFPLVMFLLAKICLAESEKVHWNVLQGSKVEMFKSAKMQLGRVVSGLLRASKWLFSDAGRERLELCRCELAELGLIHWEKSSSSVHIHHLTLKSAQNMLRANNHFMGDLLSCIPQDGMLCGDGIITEKMVSVFLSADLLIDIVARCFTSLSEASKGALENRLYNFKRSISLFNVLESVVTRCLQQATHVIWDIEKGCELLEILALSLLWCTRRSLGSPCRNIAGKPFSLRSFRCHP